MASKNYVPRLIESYLFNEQLSGRHMIFLAGPRQVGKTELARNWLAAQRSTPLYFNWDDIRTRQSYFEDSRFFESPARSLGIKDPWIVFDEIHKRQRWRDILKGIYDLFGNEFRFLVTGSARLDMFRQSGDSLVGRYNLFHMMPFNLKELLQPVFTPGFLCTDALKKMARAFEEEIHPLPPPEISDAFESLWRWGPFPEPLLRQNDRFSRKWHQDYIALMVREELRDLSRVTELDKVEHLLMLLPSRLTAPLSMHNLAAELEVAHTTVKNWLEQLRRLYLIFSVSPWHKKISRGLRKEKKWYFINWYYAAGEAARLENMVAALLYRTCLSLTDNGYGSFRLHFVRTVDKKEIDFLIVREGRPVLAVEVKSTDQSLSRPLAERKNWIATDQTIGVQVIGKPGILQKHGDYTWVVSADRFLALLN
jgi:predicted AAA+ superfamily ATPase